MFKLNYSGDWPVSGLIYLNFWNRVICTVSIPVLDESSLDCGTLALWNPGLACGGLPVPQIV